MDQKSNLEFSGSYSLNAAPAAAGKFALQEDGLRVKPKEGAALFYSLRDIVEFSGADYRVSLVMFSGEKLVLAELGHDYEDFLRLLAKKRNELIISDLLIKEKVRLGDVKAEMAGVPCELRIYETALVIMPDKAELIRLPLADIADNRQADYRLIVKTLAGQEFIFSMMGSWLDPFSRELQTALAELSLRAQTLLKSLSPGLSPDALLRLAEIFREGRGASKSEVEKLAAGLWPVLEQTLSGAVEQGDLKYLFSLADRERVQFGLKRGLGGGGEADYLWALIPLPQYKAVALEAASLNAEAEEGRATYFFRAGEADLTQLVRALCEINFRREPVYLPAEKLAEPEYQRYKFSIARLPGLRLLRERFLGRAIHSDAEQWKNSVVELLGIEPKKEAS
ncbi:MAG: hypothetical protein WCW67_05885 [Candidatus Margulisiibacteriota bacterium]|jgi:hypothetical protein